MEQNRTITTTPAVTTTKLTKTVLAAKTNRPPRRRSPNRAKENHQSPPIVFVIKSVMAIWSVATMMPARLSGSIFSVSHWHQNLRANGTVPTVGATVLINRKNNTNIGEELIKRSRLNFRRHLFYLEHAGVFLKYQNGNWFELSGRPASFAWSRRDVRCGSDWSPLRPHK